MADVPRDIKRSPPKRLAVKGFGVITPGDMLPDNLLQIARNLRIYQSGELRVRPGTTLINVDSMADGPVHSLFDLNNPIPGATQAYCILAGSTTKLFTDNATHDVFGAIQESGFDLDFSGSPLSFVIARPFQAAEPWCYIGDSTRTRKVRSDGVNWRWGAAPPTAALTAALATPIVRIVSDFEATTESAVAWGNAGTAGAISVADRLAALAITYFQYDSGSTGWASVVPATFPSDIHSGMLVIPSVNPETVQVVDVFEQIASTTIGSITYLTGPPGRCVIQPATPMAGIRKDMLLRLAGAENVRVLAVTESIDGMTSSFECVTTGTRANGNAIDGLRSFRAYFANTHTSADTLSNKYFAFQVTVGTGYITHVLARDLSNTGGRPITGDEEVHLSFYIDDITRLEEIRLLADVDVATNDFTKNYFFKVFRPSDFSPGITGTQTLITAQRTALSRQILENRTFLRNNAIYGQYYYGQSHYLPLDPELPVGFDDYPIYVDPNTPNPSQIGTGTGQWFELRFKMKDFERVGGSTERNWKDVASIRISIKATNTVNVRTDAWTIGGTYGPDSPVEDLSTLPYYYSYRYRSSTTGTKSNFAPPTRSGIMPRRNGVLLTPTASTDPQIDKIDYIRLGGAVNEWQLIGTGPNSGTFTDNLPDSAILGKKAVNLTDDFQPFPTIDTPRQGVCDVNGTIVTRVSGANFNTSWARNSEIYIDGILHTLYTSPSSTTKLELNESLGTKTSVSFFLPQPTILGQPLPSIWGPMGGAIFGGVIFACHDPYQPGVLFYTNPGDPDTTKDINQLEITSGSERLMNGCIYRGHCYVASNQMWYEVVPRFGYGYSIVDNLGAFIAQDTANKTGLYARKCLAVSKKYIYYLAEDGIYRYDGGVSECITTDLYLLFPHAGIAAQDVQLDATDVIRAPDFTQLDKQQLNAHDGLLYYSYIDTQGAYKTLVYSELLEGWISEDSYSNSAKAFRTVLGRTGEGVHELIYGAIDGKLYRSSTAALTDDGGDILAFLRTKLYDQEDARALKQFYEGWIDASTDVGVAVIGYNDFDGTIPSFTYNLTTLGRHKYLIDLGSGSPINARNIALRLSLTKGSIFAWEFSYALLPEDTLLRATANWDELGSPGAKRISAVIIEADTENSPRTILIQKDGSPITIETLLVQHNGIVPKVYPIEPPIIAHTIRVIPDPTDTYSWRYFKSSFNSEPYPEFAPITPDFDDDNDIRPKFLQGFLLEADTEGLPVALDLQGDGGVLLQTFTVNHNGRKVIDYSLDNPAFTHTMRLVPHGNIRMGTPFRTQWRWEPEPPLAEEWETQPTDLDQPSYFHLGELTVVHRSTANITMKIFVDNVEYSYIIPHSSGLQEETLVVPQAVKGRLVRFRFTSSQGFRLYLKDCTVKAGGWGREGPYEIQRPFGDISRQQGASI